MNRESHSSTDRIYEFGDYRLIPSERLLSRGEHPISLSPKVLDLLILLVEEQGHLIKKDELLETLWEDTIVEEATLAKTVSRLRKILDSKDSNSFIETVAKKGYRFSAEVKVVEEDSQLLPRNRLDEDSGKAQDAVPIPDQNTPDHSRKRVSSKRIAVVSILLGLVTLSLIYWHYQSDEISEIAKVKSIAVLPFKFLDEKERNEALELGIADTLINKLSSAKKLIIRPTRAVSKYVGSGDIDSASIGKELRVDAVVDGAIQKEGKKFRITVQLVSTSNRRILWTEKFDAQEQDIIALEDNISSRVAEALQLSLSGKELQNLGKNPTENPEAYQAYTEGRFLLGRRTLKDFEKSEQLFKKAIEKDPKYALAYTGLADVYQLSAEYRLMPMSEGFAKARDAARKALEVDETLAEAHTSLGYTLAFFDWDFESAEKSHKRAIELSPNNATSHQWYAEYLLSRGRFDETRNHLEIARKIDPDSPAIIANFATLSYLQEDYEKTLEIAKQLIEDYPQFPWGYVSERHGYSDKPRRKEYVDAYLKVAKSYYGNSDEQVSELKEVYDSEGWNALWLKRIEQMDNERNPRIYTAWEYAECYMLLGKHDRAIENLEKASEQRIRWVIAVGIDPFWKPLRSNPRFQQIVKGIESE